MMSFTSRCRFWMSSICCLPSERGKIPSSSTLAPVLSRTSCTILVIPSAICSAGSDLAISLPMLFVPIISTTTLG
jgi:hypothetical protein